MPRTRWPAASRVVHAVGRGPDAQSRARRPRRRPGCCSRPTWPTIWSARGVPFRRAHEMVGALVRKLVAEQRDFESLSLEEWRAASDLFEADVVARITPAASVRGQANAAVHGAGRGRAPRWREVRGAGWHGLDEPLC